MERIDLILKERHNRKFRSNWPWESYYQKTTRADNLLEEIERKIKSRHCIQEARKQFVTTYITAVEVYFKDNISELLGIFGNNKIIEQIKIKFDMSEVEKIINEKVSINEIIPSYFNFQDLDQINKAFSLIFDISFFEDLKNREFKISDSDLKPFKIHKNFYSALRNFINLRHDFVHDLNFKKSITRDQLNRYTYIFSFFILGVDIYFNEKIKEHDKRKKAAQRKK